MARPRADRRSARTRAAEGGASFGALGVRLDRGSPRSLALQLADGLRQAVLTGALPAGARLPPSRALAEALGISRRLVTDAYEQLAGEGCFETRAGHGTYAARLPGRAGAPPPAPAAPRPPRPPRLRFDFTPGIPDLSLLPLRAFRRALDDALAMARPADLSYGPAQGDARLREAVAGYLHRFRGLSADPARLVITAGTSQSLWLLSQLLPRGVLYCEDPGLSFARACFARAGFSVRPLAVDAAGARPEGLGKVPRGAAFYLTPSHQFPTGALLPLARRLRFLALAARADGLVLEDDYDSEFRFRGAPVAPLAALDPGRVAYLGTFSKCLAPFVRTGFMLLPSRLCEAARALLVDLNLRGPVPVQRALARFLEEGALERHVFAVKRRYRRRLAAILRFAARHPGAEVRGAETGFHVHLRLPGRRFDAGFVDACRAAGVGVSIEDDWRARPRGCDALVLGYGNVTEARIEEGLERLGELVEKKA